MEIRCGGSMIVGALAKFFLTLSIIYLGGMPLTDNCIPGHRYVYLSSGINDLGSSSCSAGKFKRYGTAGTVGVDRYNNDKLNNG